MSDKSTALLVDDNDELRGAISETIEDMGYAVSVAADAEEALRAVADAGAPREGFDLLVADVYMPGMSGIELAERLLANQPRLPVLLISSRGGEPEVRRRLAQGDVAFLAKPFSPDELAAAMDDAFDRVSERRSDRLQRQAQADSEPKHDPARARRKPPRRTLQTSRQRRARELIVAVVAVLGLGALVRSFEPEAPPLPAPAPGGPSRSATIEIIQPLGPLAAAPTELVWPAVDGAVAYAVGLRTIDGEVLWQSEAAGPPVGLPAEIQRKLHPAVTYYWSVEALDARRRLMGRSELAPFVIELAVSPDETGEPSVP